MLLVGIPAHFSLQKCDRPRNMLFSTYSYYVCVYIYIYNIMYLIQLILFVIFLAPSSCTQEITLSWQAEAHHILLYLVMARPR